VALAAAAGSTGCKGMASEQIASGSTDNFPARGFLFKKIFCDFLNAQVDAHVDIVHRKIRSFILKHSKYSLEGNFILLSLRT
jgi:hypothetical protein